MQNATRVQCERTLENCSGKLYDLIEYRLIPNPDKDAKKKWILKKEATHMYNVPRAIAYSGKRKQIALYNKGIKSIKFKVVLNGTKQYSNSFK